MRHVICLVLFCTLKTRTISSHRWVSSTSFSNQDAYDNTMNLYQAAAPPPPAPPLAYYEYEDESSSDENTVPSMDLTAYMLHPFYSQLFFPRSRNDVLVIVLEQGPANCSAKNQPANETASASPPPNAVVPPPSKCIWAIVSCCAPTTASYRYSCFNYLGCTGAFWQVNPCQLPVIMLAMNEALAYYKQFEPMPVPVPPATEKTPTNETTTAAANAVAEQPPTTEASST